MSAQAGGGVPAPWPSLYAYALRLYQSKPDGRLPHGGYPLPDPPQLRARPGWREAQAGVRDAVAPLLFHPDTVRAADEIHRRLHTLGIRDRHIQAAITDLPLEGTAAARALGRHLTRTGTSTLTVNVGIALLARLGEPEDVPYLKVLGLLRVLARPVVGALTALDCPTAALVWLANHAENRALRHLIDAIAARDDHEARAWLINAPLDSGAVGPSTARRIAEAVQLADILREEQSDTQAVAQVGRLLSRMTGLRDYQPEILSYRQATTTYSAFVARASQLPPTLDHYAILLSVALDLHSGPSVLLDWQTGQREALLLALEAVLSTQSWEAVAQSEPKSPPNAAGSIGLRAESAVFGPVASDPTISRLVDTLAGSGKHALAAIRRAGAQVREHVWALAGEAAPDQGRQVIVEPGRGAGDRALGQAGRHGNLETDVRPPSDHGVRRPRDGRRR
ncbi:hypothetical protein GCM10010317_027570 [Streptomyces mirabilis]|nr:hypothetical protein GCM10010317_027570 [Streptomyces mirabilis]